MSKKCKKNTSAKKWKIYVIAGLVLSLMIIIMVVILSGHNGDIKTKISDFREAYLYFEQKDIKNKTNTINNLNLHDKELYNQTQVICDGIYVTNRDQNNENLSTIDKMYLSSRLCKELNKVSSKDVEVFLSQTNPVDINSGVEINIRYMDKNYNILDDKSFESLNKSLEKNNSELWLEKLQIMNNNANSRNNFTLILAKVSKEENIITNEIELCKSGLSEISGYRNPYNKEIIIRKEMLKTTILIVLINTAFEESDIVQMPNYQLIQNLSRKCLASYGIYSYNDILDDNKLNQLLDDSVFLEKQHEIGHAEQEAVSGSYLWHLTKLDSYSFGMIALFELAAQCAPNGPIMSIAKVSTSDPEKARRLLLQLLSDSEHRRAKYEQDYQSNGYQENSSYYEHMNEITSYLLLNTLIVKNNPWSKLKTSCSNIYKEVLNNLDCKIPAKYLEIDGNQQIVSEKYFQNIADSIDKNKNYTCKALKTLLPILYQYKNKKISEETGVRLITSSSIVEDSANTIKKLKTTTLKEYSNIDTIPLDKSFTEYKNNLFETINYSINTINDHLLEKILSE